MTPADWDEIWASVSAIVDNIRIRNKKKIESLRQELEKLKGDKGQDANRRKQEIKGQIEALSREHQEFSARVQEKAYLAFESVVDRVLEEAKRQGQGVERGSPRGFRPDIRWT